MEDAVHLVEAILFSSSRPVKVSEIAAQTLLSLPTIRRCLKTLKKEYDDRGSAIEVAKTGDGFSLILRSEYSEAAKAFAPKEVPDEILRTAAMIAYHQPILQSDLAKMLGSRVYEDIKSLHEMGLIALKKKGTTFSLSTTKRFSEYFGIEGTRREDVKRWMEQRAKQ